GLAKNGWMYFSLLPPFTVNTCPVVCPTPVVPRAITHTPEETTFRREVRAWLKKNVPKKSRDAQAMEDGDPKRIAEGKAWQRKADAAVYLALDPHPKLGRLYRLFSSCLNPISGMRLYASRGDRWPDASSGQ